MFCATKILKAGPGTPLVFLHGFLGESGDWEEVVSHLPPCPCIGVDLPGHGSSPFSPIFDFPLPAPKFHLIGYSMGGRLAMQYALRFPERIDKLLIASAHPGLSNEEERKKRLESDAKWATLLRELPIVEFLRRWYAQPLFAHYKPDFSKRKMQNIEALAVSFMHYSLGNQPLLQINDAQFIVGEKDTKFRALHVDATVIPGATHAVHLEKPMEFAQILINKLRLS